MSQANTMQAGTRRLMYGTNVLITALLAVAVTGMAVWAAGRFGGRVDLSSAGRNSLSPRTVQLLKGLDGNLTLTGTYTTALKEVRKFAEKHRNMVAELLDLYETAGKGKVSTAMIDPSKSPLEVKALLKRIVEKPAYKDEAKPHEEAIKSFPELAQRVAALVKAETDGVEALAKDDPQLGRTTALTGIRIEMARLQQDALDTDAAIKESLESEIPRYGAAVEASRKALNTAKTTLNAVQNWMTSEGKLTANFSEKSREFFAAAPDRYKPVIAAIDAELTKTGELKPVKFEQMYETLKNGECIVVETAKEAAIVPQYEVFVARGDNRVSDDGDQSEFNGESAVSSAILKLTQTEKTGVVFVRHGGQPLLKPDFNNINLQMMRELPRAPYGLINEAMGKENFAVEEWDVATAPTPPEVKDARKVIYVLFPPAPPEGNPMMRQQQPMDMTPEQKQSVLEAVKKSGFGIFLAGWSPPRSQFDMTRTPYEYGDFLKSTWGIDVKSEYLTLEFMPARDDPKLKYPVIQSNQNQFIIAGEAIKLTDNEIGKPLQTTPVGLDGVCPLELPKAGSQPAGVKIEPIVEVPASEDLWAFGNLQRTDKDLQSRRGTVRYADDVPSPFPVAVAASNDQGQRVVVFASDTFFGDSVLGMRSLVQVGSGIGIAYTFPGNSDLFLNALHWISGDANRISVGPAKSDVPRLSKLKEGPAASFWRAFLVGIWPLCAGLVGLCVWFVRRN